MAPATKAAPPSPRSGQTWWHRRRGPGSPSRSNSPTAPSVRWCAGAMSGRGARARRGHRPGPRRPPRRKPGLRQGIARQQNRHGPESRLVAPSGQHTASDRTPLYAPTAGSAAVLQLPPRTADLLRGCHRRRLRSAISVCLPLRLWGSSSASRLGGWAAQAGKGRTQQAIGTCTPDPRCTSSRRVCAGPTAPGAVRPCCCLIPLIRGRSFVRSRRAGCACPRRARAVAARRCRP